MGALLVPEHLTRREQFTMAAMQAYIGNPANADATREEIILSSVLMADALIAALEKEEK